MSLARRNPNKHLRLAACPSLLNMVFHSMTPEVDPSDTSVISASGVVGHRSCATMARIIDTQLATLSIYRYLPSLECSATTWSTNHNNHLCVYSA
jgi:hypothetical protein